MSYPGALLLFKDLIIILISFSDIGNKNNEDEMKVYKKYIKVYV